MSFDEGPPPEPITRAPISPAKKKNRKKPTSDQVEFSQRLKMARAAANYETAAEGARALGEEEATYNRWERAETEPNITIIKKICKIYRVSADFLVLNRMHE